MTDRLGELIIKEGLVPNKYYLDKEDAIPKPHDMAMPAPWNLPSRMFQFPIETSAPTADRPRCVGMIHPLLGDHPFVQHVSELLGIELNPNGAPNECGFSHQKLATWWHAVDLVCAGKWRDLLETRQFTTDDYIAGAVNYGLNCSGHGKGRKGHISLNDACEVMAAIDADEPDDWRIVVRAHRTPRPCKSDKGPEFWPINTPGGISAKDDAWSRIRAIEAGWFKHDRSGHLQWTPLGRDQYASGPAPTYVEPSGQAAFAF